MGSNDSAMSRLAGVHTLVDVADKYEQYRAEIVRILCAYLRSDHSEDDPAIESAVLESLQDHYAVNEPSDCQWSNYSLDIHGATIHNPFVFTNCKFKTVNLDNTIFEQKVKLSNCEFEELKAKDLTLHQAEIQINNITTKNPWCIQFTEKTDTKYFAICKCRIKEIKIFGKIDYFYTFGNQINSIYISDNSTTNEIVIEDSEITGRIDIRNNSTAQALTASNNCKINKLYIWFGSTINSIFIK